MKARYAGFQARPFKGREGRWHLVDREAPMDALDARPSLCGLTQSSFATVADARKVNCAFCLKARK